MDRIPREARPERSRARAPPHKRAHIPRTRCQPSASSASPEHAYWPWGAAQAVVAFSLRLGHAPHSPSTSRRGREWAWAAVGPESCGQRRTCLPEPRAADQPVLATSTSSPRPADVRGSPPAVSQTVRNRQLSFVRATNQRTKGAKYGPTFTHTGTLRARAVRSFACGCAAACPPRSHSTAPLHHGPGRRGGPVATRPLVLCPKRRQASAAVAARRRSGG